MATARAGRPVWETTRSKALTNWVLTWTALPSSIDAHADGRGSEAGELVLEGPQLLAVGFHPERAGEGGH